MKNFIIPILLFQLPSKTMSFGLDEFSNICRGPEALPKQFHKEGLLLVTPYPINEDSIRYTYKRDLWGTVKYISDKNPQHWFCQDGWLRIFNCYDKALKLPKTIYLTKVD